MERFVLSVCIAQQAPAGAQASGSLAELAPFLPALLLVLAIVFIPYLILNSVLAWLASNIMSFRRATLGNGLKFSVLSLLIPVPVALAGSVGLYVLMKDSSMLGRNADLLSFVYPIICFFVLAWLLSVVVAAIVYRVGLLRAAAFNMVLWLVNAVVSFVVRAAT